MMRLRQLASFKLQRLVGSRVDRCYSEFISLERGSAASLQLLQERRLERKLTAAVSEIPFYRSRVRASESPSLDDFPILKKADIRECYRDLMSDELRLRYQRTGKPPVGYSWKEVKTGGSEGTPTTVIHDPELRDSGRAARLYSQFLCGFPFGTPYFRLWGSMDGIAPDSAPSLAVRVQSRLAREIPLNSFRMSSVRKREYLERMRNSEVGFLMAYADAAYELARFAQANGIAVRPLTAIMACAGTVTDDLREALVSVFRARVHNKYGSRDCADMACECERGGLHYYSNHYLLEVVDAAGNRLPFGRTGRLLVTLLRGGQFPLIRYEIGDMASLSAETCDCGRPFPLLGGVEGRAVEFLTATDGSHVTPVYVRHLIGVVHNPGCIKRFQLVQRSLTDLDLAIVLEEGFGQAEAERLYARISTDLVKVLGADCRLTIVRKDQLEDAPGGKFLYTINQIGRGDR